MDTSTPQLTLSDIRPVDIGALRLKRLKHAVVCVVCLLCWASAGPALFAQQILGGEEVLAKDRPEAWAMKLVTSELEMLTGVARDVKPWSVEMGLESGWIPSLDATQRLIGFNGTKEENVNRTPAYVRPRVSVGLPASISLDLAYIPPVRLGGIRPNHLAWSLGRPIVSRSRWRVGGRVHGQFGNLRGDITCDKETVAAGPDPIRNPFGCEAPSNDEMRVRAVGLEVGSAFALGKRIEPYATVGWNYFKGEFQTDARYSGVHDISFQSTSGPTFPLSAGVGYRISERIRVDASAFYTPLQVRRQGIRVTDGLFNLRFSVSYRIR
jgi:opacity protein-like surface antigen